MPEITRTLSIPCPAEQVKEVLFSARRLGTLFHTVERTEGNEDEASWYLKTAFRITLGTPFLKCTFASRTANTLEWQATAQYLQWKGRFRLVPKGEAETDLEVNLQIEDTGPLAVPHNALIAVQIGNVLTLFERNLKKALEACHG